MNSKSGASSRMSSRQNSTQDPVVKVKPEVELPEVVNSQFNSQGGAGIHDPSRSTRYEEPGMGADKITVMGLNSDTEVGNNTNNQRNSMQGLP